MGALLPGPVCLLSVYDLCHLVAYRWGGGGLVAGGGGHGYGGVLATLGVTAGLGSSARPVDGSETRRGAETWWGVLGRGGVCLDVVGCVGTWGCVLGRGGVRWDVVGYIINQQVQQDLRPALQLIS